MRVWKKRNKAGEGLAIQGELCTEGGGGSSMVNNMLLHIKSCWAS